MIGCNTNNIPTQKDTGMSSQDILNIGCFAGNTVMQMMKIEVFPVNRSN